MMSYLSKLVLFIKVQPTSGTWPRHFTISKSGNLMFVALQNWTLREETTGNKIDAFKIEATNGRLTKLGSYESFNNASYIGIL